MKPLDTVMFAKSRPDFDGPPAAAYRNLDGDETLLFGMWFGSQINTARSHIGLYYGRVWLIADIPENGYTLKENEMGLTKAEIEQGGVYYYGFPEFKIAKTNEFKLTTGLWFWFSWSN